MTKLRRTVLQGIHLNVFFSGGGVDNFILTVLIIIHGHKFMQASFLWSSACCAPCPPRSVRSLQPKAKALALRLGTPCQAKLTAAAPAAFSVAAPQKHDSTSLQKGHKLSVLETPVPLSNLIQPDQLAQKRQRLKNKKKKKTPPTFSF